MSAAAAPQVRARPSGLALKLGALLVVLVALPLVPTALSTYNVRLVTQMLIWALFAMSLDLMMGYAGLPSLGHAAYFGVGAYTVALMGVHAPGAPFLVVLLAGVGISVVLGLVYGALVLRTSGVGLLLITLTLAQLLWGLAFRWSAFTGGDNGLTLKRAPSVLGWHASSVSRIYYLTLVISLVAMALIYVVSVSRFGRSLVGIRQSPSRMAALGYHVWLHKYLVVVIAGAFAGLAGVLSSYQQQFVSPNDLAINTSIQVLLMVIIGGVGTLFGPALGAVVLIWLQDAVSSRTSHWLMVMGGLYVLVMLVAPRGIVGEPRYRLRRRAAAPVASAEETA